MAPSQPAPLAAVARAGLTAATVAGLARVFPRGGWIAAALVAATVPHALGAVAARRHVRSAVLAAALAGTALVFTAYVVVPETLHGPFPTGETVRSYTHLLADGPEVLRSAVVPVAPVGAALLLALVALWAAGAVAEWSARRPGRELVVAAPSLVLFVAVAALGEGTWVPATVVYALAVAGYLLALQAGALHDRRTWFDARHAHRSRLLAGGSTAAAVAVAVAALIAPQVPGARGEAWLDYRSIGDGGGDSGLLRATSPIVDIHAKLRENPEHVVFNVTADRPAYWRVIALDDYDGTLWTLDDEGVEADDIPPAPEQPTSTVVEQRFELRGADPHWLPAAYRAQDISLRAARVVPESMTLYVTDDDRLTDVSYTVLSRVAAPTLEERRAAQPVDPRRFARYLELPSGISDRVREVARDIAADAAGPYEQALALQDFFTRSGRFTYELDVALREDIDSIEDFLFEVQAGYCEQFSSSFAVMARAIGLPTRVAVGYTPGEYLGGGQYRVRNEHAHAWPEVYLDGIGWAPFEPTPGRYEPNYDHGDADAAPASSDGAAPTEPTTPTTAANPVPTSQPDLFADSQVSLEGPEGPDSSPGAARRAVTAILGTFAVAASAVLLALVALFAAAWRRTWCRRHASDTRERVAGAWVQALEYLAEAGIDPKPSATATEFALRYAPAQGAGDAGIPLAHLARLHTAAVFAPNSPSEADAIAAWEHTDAVDRALWSKVSILVRVARRLDPRRQSHEPDA